MSHTWVRVRDKRTGHQYDVTEERLALLVKRGDPVEEVDEARRHKGKANPPKFSRPLGSITPTASEAAPLPEAVAEEEGDESE